MMENHSIQAVIWDMGGVLVRTEDYHPREALAAQFGMTRLELEDLVFTGESADLASVGKISYRDHFAKISRALRLSPQALEAFERAFWAGDRMDWELISFIKNLRPDLKTGLLSNAWSETRNIVERAYSFAFDHVFDTTVFSADVGLMKPQAEIYRLVLERLNCPAERAVFIDDMPGNIEGARAVGLRGIRFTSHEQTISELRAMLANE